MSALLDFVYNAGISGVATASYLAAERLYHSRLGMRAVPPSVTPRDQNSHVEDLVPEIKLILENLLHDRLDERISDQGSQFSGPDLVRAEVWRQAGIQREDIYREEVKRPDKYQFILTFTSARQDGLEVTQPYIMLLTKAMAKAIDDLGHPVAINCVGKDFTVVKRAQDPLDLPVLDHLPVAPVLNLHQGVEAVASLDALEATVRNIFFFFVNGNSPISDRRYVPSIEFGHSSRVYAYQLGKEGSDLELADMSSFTPQWTTHIPRVYANAFVVSNVASLQSSFADFIHQAKQYR